MYPRLTRFAILATALLAAPLHADDTEIYLGANLDSVVKPNIIFIMDTSISMTTNFLMYSDYDPDTEYAGTCDKDKAYWNNGAPPDCATTKNWFKNDTTYNTCESLRATLNGIGTVTAKNWGYFSGSKWYAPAVAGQNYKWECSDDSGKNGEYVGDLRKYPYNASPGWTTSSKSAYSLKGFTAVNVYTGNYLNYLKGGGAAAASLSRLIVVQRVLARLMDSLSGVNVAVMQFDGSSASLGGFFIVPMTELNDANRPGIKAKVLATVKNNSYTPLAETLYEAGLYLQAKPEVFGATKNVAGVSSGGTYISPIKYQCQRNFIVMLSDGDPYDDNDADTMIAAQPNFKTIAGTCSFNSGNDCLAAQAKYLHTIDLSSALLDRQWADFYGIGLLAADGSGMSAAGKALMNQAAANGGGFFRGVSDANDMISAFDEVLVNILAQNTTFTAPAVSVNAFNRLTYLDQLYYAVFRPGDQPKWDGNIKRYRLAKPAGGSELAILDANGSVAVDPNTGFFKAGATSFWTGAPVVDGDQVVLGGAASKMPLPRNVYTCCFGGSMQLTNSSNAFHENNSTNLTASLLGVGSEADRVAVLQWARGVDVKDSDIDASSTDARTQMGDPLHTEPLLVTYGKNGDGSPNMTIYATTNEGFLHAIDTSTGVEQFSFIPQELIGQLKDFYNDTPHADHPYGLDGPMGIWTYDYDHDGIVDPADGDHVYLYLTMRRGGDNIYALDVTNRSAPKLMWKILGGTGSYTELGQTWSKPTLAKVKLNGTVRTVLFFGGGYDTAEDGNGNGRMSDTIGRAIYMVDAENGGSPLWVAGPGSGVDLQLTAMTNSIPSDVRVVDVDGDNLADRIYVGDMGGRIWRIDVNPLNTGRSNFATGGVLADLNDGTATGNRRFYYMPSVSLSTAGDYLNIAIGSGFREHPLSSTVHDRFYVLRDKNVFTPQQDASHNAVYNPLSNLVNATGWLTGDQVNTAALKASDGFYIDLAESGSWIGEKVLAQAVTSNGMVAFTTYTPVEGSQQDSCAPNAGMARLYELNVEDSTPTNSGAGVSGRSQELPHSGIAPRPELITVPDGSAIVVGTTVTKANDAVPQLKKWSWRRN